MAQPRGLPQQFRRVRTLSELLRKGRGSLHSCAFGIAQFRVAAVLVAALFPRLHALQIAFEVVEKTHARQFPVWHSPGRTGLLACPCAVRFGAATWTCLTIFSAPRPEEGAYCSYAYSKFGLRNASATIRARSPVPARSNR